LKLSPEEIYSYLKTIFMFFQKIFKSYLFISQQKNNLFVKKLMTKN